MKISSPSGPKYMRATGKPIGASPGSAAPPNDAATPIADRISLAGVPQAELTPRVREALTALMHEIMQLRRDFDAAQARIAELEQLADSDPLLGILNRRAFTRELSRAIAMIDRYQASASLVFIDLNDLKSTNDTHGHAAGDAALEHVARILSANIRQTDAVGRLGGDEFGVILSQTPLAVAEEKASSLAGLVAAERAPWREGDLNVRIAFGVVALHGDDTVAQALARADQAMYAVKRGQHSQ